MSLIKHPELYSTLLVLSSSFNNDLIPVSCSIVKLISHFAQKRQEMHDGRHRDGKVDKRHLYSSFYGVPAKPTAILVK